MSTSLYLLIEFRIVLDFLSYLFNLTTWIFISFIYKFPIFSFLFVSLCLYLWALSFCVSWIKSVPFYPRDHFELLFILKKTNNENNVWLIDGLIAAWQILKNWKRDLKLPRRPLECHPIFLAVKMKIKTRLKREHL